MTACQARLQLDGDDAVGLDLLKVGQPGALDAVVLGQHDQVVVLCERRHRQHGRDAVVLADRQHLWDMEQRRIRGGRRIQKPL